jgi:hypothetical protein
MMEKATHQTRSKTSGKASTHRPATGKKPATGKFGGIAKAVTAKPGPKPAKPVIAVPEVLAVRPPLTDEQVGPIPGVPSEAEIEQRAGELSPADKGRFTRIRGLLARRLGSHAAARVWLTTPGRGFDGTPLDAIREGMADLVLEVLKDQSTPNPPYA